MPTSEQNFESWKENLRRNAEANPTWGALRLIESTPNSGAFSVTGGSKSGVERRIKTHAAIHLFVTTQARALLLTLKKTGLYGRTIEETAERLLCESLRRHAELPARRQPRSNIKVTNTGA